MRFRISATVLADNVMLSKHRFALRVLRLCNLRLHLHVLATVFVARLPRHAAHVRVHGSVKASSRRPGGRHKVPIWCVEGSRARFCMATAVY